MSAGFGLVPSAGFSAVLNGELVLFGVNGGIFIPVLTELQPLHRQRPFEFPDLHDQ